MRDYRAYILGIDGHRFLKAAGFLSAMMLNFGMAVDLSLDSLRKEWRPLIWCPLWLSPQRYPMAQRIPRAP
jgi:hypothetical protein